jgi:hypothetical protein
VVEGQYWQSNFGQESLTNTLLVNVCAVILLVLPCKYKYQNGTPPAPPKRKNNFDSENVPRIEKK